MRKLEYFIEKEYLWDFLTLGSGLVGIAVGFLLPLIILLYYYRRLKRKGLRLSPVYIGIFIFLQIIWAYVFIIYELLVYPAALFAIFGGIVYLIWPIIIAVLYSKRQKKRRLPTKARYWILAICVQLLWWGYHALLMLVHVATT